MSCRVMETTEIEEARNFLIILDRSIKAIESKSLHPRKNLRSSSFIGFFVAEDTTVQSLASLVLKQREEHLPLDECRGQSSESQHGREREGVRVCMRTWKRIRGPFWWHVGQTLILVVSDAAEASQVAISYFGYFQKTPLLSRDLTRAILPKHVWVREWRLGQKQQGSGAGLRG